MRHTHHITIPLTILVVSLFASCASTGSTTRVSDDVYHRPDGRMLAGTSPDRTAPGQEDYYDPATASTLAERSFYDVAYNDPYYYNYGRFGFGATMGTWGSGWNMNYGLGTPGWGMNGWNMSVGMGMGTGWGWNAPFYGPMGGWGWNDPFYNPYWGWGGMGPYYGWGGPCWGCYQPVVYCGNTTYQHRPGLSGGGTGSPGSPSPQLLGRDPAGLIAAPRRDMQDTRWSTGRSVPSSSSRPSMDRPSRSRAVPSASPTRSRGGSPSMSPSPSRMGGGSRPSMGGSRPSMGGRPR